MNGPRIVLRFSRNCQFAGSARDFAGPIVRIGRRPDNDLVFDPKRDLLVSGHHAEIRHVDGRTLVVDVGSKNGTFVNGERIRAPMPLMPGDRIELGPEGPEFSIEIVADAGDTSLPGSVPAARAPRRVHPDDPTPPPSSLYGSAPISGTPQAKPAASGGAVAARSKRRVGALVGAIVVLGALGLGARAFLGSKDVTTTPTPRDADWKSVFAERGKSVYAVVLRETRGSTVVDRTIGTAFSASPGKLATNAHIAALHFALAPGQSLLARSNRTPPRDLRIVGAELHPGFEAFDALIERYVPYDAQQDAFVCTIEQLEDTPEETLAIVPGRPLIAPCDVATFAIDPADMPLQEPPLPLAPPTRFPDLASGEPVAYVGFPSEGLARGGSDVDAPAAFHRIGTLNKTTDCVLSVPKTTAEAIQLAFNLEITGGASGSPVFDSNGIVIGLVAAGDFHFDMAGGRLPIGGSSYGPRVDLLAELLDGKAATLSQTRATSFKTAVAQMFKKGTSKATLIAEGAARARLGVDKVAVADDWQYALTKSNEPGGPTATGPFLVRADTAGRHVLCAIAIDQPIPLRLGLTVGKTTEQIVDAALVAPYVAVTELGALEVGAEVTVRALAREGEDADGVDVAFFVLRGVDGP